MNADVAAAGSEPFLIPWVHCEIQPADHISMAMQPSIRVVVSSGERLLREVLEASLMDREELEVVFESAAADGAFDVLLVDAGRDLSAAQARVWEARERWPEAKVIAVGLEREDETVVELTEAGAGGYVLRNASPDDLVAAIRAAQEGLAACSPWVVASVLARIAELSHAAVPAPVALAVEPLTAREREILAFLATGASNKEVGRRLRITVQTVKNHVHRILEKLGVHRRRDAVRRAFDLGILAEPGEIPPAGRIGPMEKGGAGGLNPF